MSIKDALVKEFHDELRVLSQLDVGDVKYSATVNGVSQLADRIIELEKIEAENQIKMETVKDEKQDRWIRNGIEGAKVIGGFGLAAWALVVSINFEKEGTFTTEAGRSALRQLLKFMK